MGRQAWHQVQRLLTEPVDHEVSYLEAELVIRSSTGPARTANAIGTWPAQPAASPAAEEPSDHTHA
jgi:hypothetical protein